MRTRLVLLAALAILATGCDADMAKLSAIGAASKVTLYSGGKPVREWRSKGHVETEEKSDGYYFSDATSGALVRVSGDVVIEPVD